MLSAAAAWENFPGSFLLGKVLRVWDRVLAACPAPPLGPWVSGGNVSNILCSSNLSLGRQWEHFPLLPHVFRSMVGAFPICPVPPLSPWVNGGIISYMSCSSFGFLGQRWECFQGASLLHCVLGSMMGMLPPFSAPPSPPWVNGEHFQYILLLLRVLGSMMGSFPTCPAPPLIPWVNGGIISKRPHSSVVSLGQWWEHFQPVLLLRCVLGSILGSLPRCPSPPLCPWVNGGSISKMPYSSFGSLGQ